MLFLSEHGGKYTGHSTLSEALKLEPVLKKTIVSVVGAGGKTTCVRQLAKEQRAAGLHVEIAGDAHEAGEDADLILAESDSARGMPFKMPAQQELKIAKDSHMIVIVAGLGAVGRPVSQCFGKEILMEILHKKEGALLETEDMAKALIRGYLVPLKKTHPKARFACVLNQADMGWNLIQAQQIISMLRGDITCVIAEMNGSQAGEKI